MEGEFLGLDNINDTEKRHLYDILNAYAVVRNYLSILGIRADEQKLAGVVGMLVERGTNIDTGLRIGYMFTADLSKRQDFFEKLDWSKLSVISNSMVRMKEKLLKIKTINPGLKLLIFFRFADWTKIALGLAQFGLYLLIFLSVLYVLVATQWGRDLTWEFLNVYGWIVKMILIVFLVIGLVVIVSMVSFMYLENKNIKKEEDNA